MRSEWIACQIMGFVFQLGGAYIVGDWKIVIGVCFMLWGYGLMISVRRPPKSEPFVLKDWIGNQRAGG